MFVFNELRTDDSMFYRCTHAFRTATTIRRIQSKRIFILPVVVRSKSQTVISFSNLYKSRPSSPRLAHHSVSAAIRSSSTMLTNSRFLLLFFFSYAAKDEHQRTTSVPKHALLSEPITRNGSNRPQLHGTPHRPSSTTTCISLTFTHGSIDIRLTRRKTRRRHIGLFFSVRSSPTRKAVAAERKCYLTRLCRERHGERRRRRRTDSKGK